MKVAESLLSIRVGCGNVTIATKFPVLEGNVVGVNDPGSVQCLLL